MSYPVTPTASLAALQARVALVAATPVERRSAGAVGGAVSTMPVLPKTWNSARAYRCPRRHGWVAYTRTNRPNPVTAMSSRPPWPVVVEETVRHHTPSGEVCTWYARAQPPAQVRLTRLTVDWAPRSTDIHCSSPPRLRHAVAGSPSTAAVATRAGPASLEAVAGLPCESRVSSAAYAGGAPQTAGPSRGGGGRHPQQEGGPRAPPGPRPLIA